MVILITSLIILVGLWFTKFRPKPATEEVEYKVDPWWGSNSRVTLSYRFMGERKWRTIKRYEDMAWGGKPYGEFTSETFVFEEDGNYEHLKKRFTKEAIKAHNKALVDAYNSVKKTRQEKAKLERGNVSKRI